MFPDAVNMEHNVAFVGELGDAMYHLHIFCPSLCSGKIYRWEVKIICEFQCLLKFHWVTNFSCHLYSRIHTPVTVFHFVGAGLTMSDI